MQNIRFTTTCGNGIHDPAQMKYDDLQILKIHIEGLIVHTEGFTVQVCTYILCTRKRS
jgi:hypothetical protein